MLPEEWPLARSVLTEALRVQTGDRPRFIEDAYPDNPRLWDELLAILEGYERATRSVELAWGDDAEFDELLASLMPLAQRQTPSVPRQTTALLTVGQQYGSYRVIKELKPGGMATVFLAEDVRMPRRVVLKSLAGKWLASPIAVQRLMREASTACVLSHGNIATLYDVLKDTEPPLLVFEYVEGRTLREKLAEGPLPLGLALRLAIQISDAITYAHDNGIIHCDIKPENVQIENDRRAKVLDFGLARAQLDPDNAVSESERGSVLGTPGYVAPERLRRGTLNASGDIYCLGVVLFELLTGRHPYAERGAQHQILAALATDAPRPSSLVPDLPAELDRITERALARDPVLRYQTARELSRDLGRALALVDPPQPMPGADEQIRSREHGRGPAFWALVGLAAIPAVLIALTIAGFASVIMYNSPLGRTGDFEPESPLWWPVRGLQLMLAPSFVGAGAAVVLVLAPFLGRLVTIGPLGRLFAPVTAWMRIVAARIRSTPTAAVAPAILLIQFVALALAFRRFRTLFTGLDSFITRRPPADLSALRPDNRAEQNFFGEVLNAQVIVFGLAWIQLLKHRRRRGEREGMPIIAAGFAVTALYLLFGQIFPFRILYHNEAERVVYDSRRCYLVGQRGTDALIFCPQQPPPWTQIVKLDDPALRREGAVESIFTGFNRSR